jgi:hypothetical protein
MYEVGFREYSVYFSDKPVAHGFGEGDGLDFANSGELG